ncbi:hypothetical protein MKW92_030562 [Papaver armeniacum]|nr:hypothetical protein MKW92_030562 [Papaver armeniacum]
MKLFYLLIVAKSVYYQITPLLPLLVDIGILRLRLNDQWLKIALMGGFVRVGNNEITILVNDAEKGRLA